MTRFTRTVGVVALVSACLTGGVRSAFALGFRNPDQGARATGQGEAFVAQADDASAIYYNPAGLTQVTGTQFTSGGMIGMPSWQFSGPTSDDEMNTAYVLPHLYAATDFGLERWRFGLGANVPFGNMADYSDSGPMRYTTTKSSLVVQSFQPTVAFQINEHLSIGAGVNIYSGETQVNRLVPLSVLLGLPFPDGRFQLDANGVSVGATVGVMWKINEQHSFGAVYRAPFSIDFEGHCLIKNDLTGSFGRSAAEAEIDFPQSIAVGYAFRPVQKLKLEVDVEWTNWDTLNDVPLSSPNPAFDSDTNPTSTIPFHWQDSFFYEFGAQYDLTANWTVRGGYIFSENTVPEKTFSANVPDSDRHVFSVGLGFQTTRFAVDVVYQYSLSDDRNVTGSPDNSLDGIGDADGHWETSAHGVMVTSTDPVLEQHKGLDSMGIYDALATKENAGKPAVKPTLLIVDDQAGPRESLRIVFKDRYQCATATTGQEGIDYARTHSVDAAILDIKMPDYNGVDVLRELKKIDPDTECIMLTGFETLETARSALRLGAADYVNKPFDVVAIREILAKCLARRKQKHESVATVESLKRMNEELSSELAQSHRAVTAGVISAGVVHEINNPLSIIAGYTQMLARDLAALESGKPDAAQSLHQRLNSIHREIERCKDIAKRFLNFSRSRQATPDWVDAANLLEDVASLVKAHPANHGVEIAHSVAEEGLRFKAHAAEVLQILLNLGVNGVHAMDGKGRIEFTAKRFELGPTDAAFRADRYDAQQAFIRFSIIDTGSGIAPENLQKIFQPYFTTKTQGTGLGLAIICELVGRYGGAIDVESEVGKGTTFNVFLPVGSDS